MALLSVLVYACICNIQIAWISNCLAIQYITNKKTGTRPVKSNNRIIRDTFPLGMSLGEPYACKQTSAFARLANSIRGKATKQVRILTRSNKKDRYESCLFYWRRIREAFSCEKELRSAYVSKLSPP